MTPVYPNDVIKTVWKKETLKVVDLVLFSLLTDPAFQLRLVIYETLKWQIDAQVFGGTLDVESLDDSLGNVKNVVKSFLVQGQGMTGQLKSAWLWRVWRLISISVVFMLRVAGNIYNVLVVKLRLGRRASGRRESGRRSGCGVGRCKWLYQEAEAWGSGSVGNVSIGRETSIV
jgi:hypothetical protein